MSAGLFIATVHHSDRGSQYIRNYNALAEMIHRRGAWRSFEAVEFATLTWVDWFNNRWLLGPIGNIPPAEAEARYYVLLDE